MRTGLLACLVTTLLFDVARAGSPPVVDTTELLVTEDEPAVLQIPASDPDGGPVALFTTPAGRGRLRQVNEDGTPGAEIAFLGFTQVTNSGERLYFEPLADDFGLTSIIVYARDGEGLTSSPPPVDGGTQVSIHVAPVNDAPVGQEVAATLPLDVV